MTAAPRSGGCGSPRWLSWQSCSVMTNKRRNDAGRRSGRLAQRGRDGSVSPLEPLEGRLLMAATYYVAPTGSDSNWGDLARPLKTIQEAANRAAAGDTVLIRG